MKTKTIILTGIFSGLIFVTTAYLFHIPTIHGGYIHVGDAFIYFAACILPKPYAMVSAAIGAGFSDLLSPGGAVWVIPTVIIKPFLCLPFKNANKFINKRNIMSTIIAGIIGIIGYYIAEVIMFKNFIAPLIALPMGLFQPLGSMIIFILVGYSLDKIDFKKRIKL